MVPTYCDYKTDEDHYDKPNQDGNINTISDLTNMYPDSFEGIGNFDGAYHIVTDPTIPPVVHAPRRPPISMICEIKEELDQMERTGVIEKVTEHTDWVSSLVYACKQSGKLRICLDPRYLNNAIKTPLPDDDYILYILQA